MVAKSINEQWKKNKLKLLRSFQANKYSINYMKKNIHSCKKIHNHRKENAINIALIKKIEETNEKKSYNLKKKSGETDLEKR